MKEIWRNLISIRQDGTILDFTDYYEVSNRGDIKNKSGYILKPRITHNGYLRIHLRKNKESYYIFVHNAVASTYQDVCGKWFKGAQVNHKSEIKTDNSVSNLEWVTISYNANYGTRNKRVSEHHKGKGNPFWGKHHSEYQKERNRETHTKKVLQYNSKMVLIGEYPSIKEAAMLNNIAACNISSVCNNKPHNKTAGGYIWKFKS